MLFRSLIFAVVSLLLFARDGCAHDNKPIGSLEIGNVTFNPQFLQIGPKPNFIKVTVKLIDSPFHRPPHTLLLKKIRSLPNGKTRESTVGALEDDGKGPDKKARDGIYSGTAIIQQKTSDEVRFRVVAEHNGVLAASEVFTRLAGSIIKPGKGGTVQGADGIIVTIPADSIPYEAQVAIVPAVTGDITAPVNDVTPLINVMKLVVKPVQANLEVTPLQKPLQISFPVPNNLSTSNFIVTKEIEVPLPGKGEDKGGFFNRLTPVDTAVLDSKSNRIVTETTFYDGIFGSGLYALLENVGSDNIDGHVCEAGNPQPLCTGTKVPSVVVTNNTNTLVAVTNAQGLFKLFISGTGSYDLTAFDSLRGFSGEAPYTLPQQIHDTDVVLTKKFTFSGFDATLAGLRNGGFECVKNQTADSVTHVVSAEFCDGYWSFETNGEVNLVDSVLLCDNPTNNPACPNSDGSYPYKIQPNEGRWMAKITTGIHGEGQLGSALAQRLTIPKGATKLYFDYIFLSEEFNEFVNSRFNDKFKVSLTTKDPNVINKCPNSTHTLPTGCTSINDSSGITSVRCNITSNTVNTDLTGDSTDPTVDSTLVMSINQQRVGTETCFRPGNAKCLPPEAMFNCAFDGGDDTCGKIPFVSNDRNKTLSEWATASFDVSQCAGTDIQWDLVFTTSDFGDDIFDTAVLIDNIRFNTVFLDVNAVQGVLPGSMTDCTSPLSCVQNDLFGFDNAGARRYGANEILSQAGLNLRLRRDAQGNEVVDTISLTGGNTTLIAKFSGAVTSQASTMLATSRNNIGPTAQVYYVGNIMYRRNINGVISDTSAQGIAFTAEDDSLTRFNNDGVAVATGVVTGCNLGGHNLSHELGHLLMTSVVDGALEHSALGTFMTQATACQLPGNGEWKIVRPDQQNKLNDSPYLIEQ